MPDARSADVYTTDEVDALLGAQEERISALEARVTALEAGGGPPPEPPDPDLEGIDLEVAAFNPPDLTQGRPANLKATVRNRGTVDVPAGDAHIIGVGFLCDGVAATWASTTEGLGAGLAIDLATDTAQWSGGPWTPAVSGDHELIAFVDDDARIAELDEDNNQAVATVTIAEGTAPPVGAATLFASSSLWNTPKSPSVFASGADGLLSSSGYGLNNGDYSHPMTWSSSSDPIHTFEMPNTWGWPAQTIHANMRDDATPAGGTDGHLCLLNADGRLFDMWILRSTGHRSWRCEAWAQHRWTDGTGFGAPPYGPSAGVTVCGAPTAAGTITAAEIDAGVIPHALCMAFDYSNQGGVNTSWAPHVPPAIANDVGGGPGPICEGALLVACGAEPSGLNASELAVWEAASTFGCFVVDKLDGAPMFFGDRSSTVGNALRGDKLTAIGRKLRMVKTW